MTTRRAYDRTHSLGQALRELHNNAGTQFDPAVVDALEQTLSPHLGLAGREVGRAAR